MTITAKYAGRCATCGGRIAAGDRIDWDRASRRTTHETCAPGGTERAAQRAAAVATSRAAAPEAAAVEVRAAAEAIPAPEGLEYMPFQRVGIALAASREASLFGDEMGLGKTVQAVGVINADPSITRVIVVCPASLRLNWRRELTRWLVRPLTVGIATTSEWPETQVVILNWDIVAKLRGKIDQVEWDLAVLDEAHYAKNPKAARTKAVLGTEPKGKGTARTAGDRGIKARRRLALTGTPIPNRPIEIQPILSWLDRGAWQGWFRFALRYAGAYRSRWGWDFSGASNLPELQERLRTSILIRRLKADVLTELPPKRRQVVLLAPNGAAGAVEREQAEYGRHEALLDSLRLEVELSAASDDPAEYEAAVARLAAASRVAFSEISRARHETALAKVESVVAHAQDALESGGAGHKLVLFGHHHDVIAALRDGLSEYNPVVLTGETPLALRQAAVDRFQTEPSCRVFIGSITAAGVGLTLTASSHVVFAELDWVPGNVTQAEDRTHRIGQRDSVLVQHVVLDGSLDAKLVRTLIAKQDVADRALDRVEVEPEPVDVGEERPRTRREELDEVAAKLTPADIERIHAALRTLAGVCDGAALRDGQGFNKLDAGIGHELARRERLTPRQAALGAKLCRKYRRQLGGVELEA